VPRLSHYAHSVSVKPVAPSMTGCKQRRSFFLERCRSHPLSFEAVTAYRFPVPASFFGMVLGLVGLGNCWRTAARLWGAPGWIGESILPIATIVWALLLLAYAGKWIWARSVGARRVSPPGAMLLHRPRAGGNDADAAWSAAFVEQGADRERLRPGAIDVGLKTNAGLPPNCGSAEKSDGPSSEYARTSVTVP
jgi:hypothetical protein